VAACDSARDGGPQTPGLVARSVGAKPLQTPGAYGDILRDQEGVHVVPGTGPEARLPGQCRAGTRRRSRATPVVY
jgi:hypothetical protein